jgi:hypothetical protein
MTMIDFEFPRGLKNSVAMFQATVRQPAMIDPIDSPVRPVIKNRSPRLILGEIQTTKPEESTWSGVAIEKRSIPPASTQQSTGLRHQNAAPLHQSLSTLARTSAQSDRRAEPTG